MEIIKYTEVDKLDHSVSFGLSKMEDIYDKRKGKSNEPRRHEFYGILLTDKAKDKHFIIFSIS